MKTKKREEIDSEFPYDEICEKEVDKAKIQLEKAYQTIRDGLRGNFEPHELGYIVEAMEALEYAGTKIQKKETKKELWDVDAIKHRIAVEAVSEYLDTLKRSELPYEFAMFAQHVLLVYIKETSKKGSAGQKLLFECYNSLSSDTPEWGEENFHNWLLAKEKAEK